MAIAVETQMLNVICINFARGSKFTVTTAMMATRNPKEVKTSDTGVLWYMAREMATGIEPLIDRQLWTPPLTTRGNLLQHEEESLAVDFQRMPPGAEALVHSRRRIATGYSKRDIVWVGEQDRVTPTTQKETQALYLGL
jgi:hypothetical protein